MMTFNFNNKLKVLSQIARKQPISRGKLSALTNLPSPTITNIISEFIQNEMVEEVGYQVSSGGRKPALLELCAEKFFLLGVELNAQQLTVQLIDLKSKVHLEIVEELGSRKTQGELVELLLNGIDRCLTEKAALRSRITGIGVGVSGLVDSAEGLSFQFPGIHPWPRLELAKLIEERFHIPTFLENNVALRTLAELWFGLGRGRNNFLYLSVGPHIRMGIVIGGRLYRGLNGNAGELGHTTYHSDGPLCYCGNSGCLELYASTKALVQEVRQVLKEPGVVSDSPLATADTQELDSRHIFEAARSGDRLANSILDRVLEPLGLSIASLVNLFDTESVILGGPLAEEADLVLERLRQMIDKHSLPHLAESVTLEATQFGPEGGALGGGALIMQQMFTGVIPIRA